MVRSLHTELARSEFRDNVDEPTNGKTRVAEVPFHVGHARLGKADSFRGSRLAPFCTGNTCAPDLRSRMKPATYAIDPWHSRRRWCSRSRNEEFSRSVRTAGRTSVAHSLFSRMCLPSKGFATQTKRSVSVSIRSANRMKLRIPSVGIRDRVGAALSRGA